ncbi:HAD-IA family hydrolase [bacterium]|nr:HAD-IA family hydrolase [bacterium]
MIKAVLWDLDGTILDTTELILLSYRHAFATVISREIEDKESLSNFGEPLISVMTRYSPKHAEALMNAYRDHNHKHHDNYIEPFAGIIDALANIKRRGFKQAIVTSKTEWLSRRGLKLFELLGYFDEIVGFESTEEHKPLPAPALETIRRMKVLPSDVLFVGDSLADCLCAEKAGIKFVFVKWGPNPDALGEKIPDYSIDDPRDILYLLPEVGPRIR